VQGALNRISGVINVNVSLPDNAILTLKGNRVTVDELLAAVKATGFNAEIQN
tara:strand:- start:356 stop:511 length:156 start_codon:yes stop_codon:yes gene_type:complete